jgi:hypothetical protein
MAAQKSRGGRPPRHAGEILSKNRTFRVRDNLDQQLRTSAANAGRTVSLEIERRLEDSYFRDRLEAVFLGSDVGGEILRLIRLAMAAEGVVGLDWDRNPVRSENLRVTINAIIATVCELPLELPPPEKRTEGLRNAKHLLLVSNVRRKLPNEILFSDLEDLEFGEVSARPVAPSGGGEG